MGQLASLPALESTNSGPAVALRAIALLASLIPASLALRRPPLELAGVHE